MFLHDPVANAQPQTSALAHRFRGVKRIEDAVRLANPRTRIRKKNHHIRAVALRLDRQHAAALFGHGVQRVVDDVEEHYKTAKQNGAEILSEIEGGFPGKRYRCADVEGHRWMFMQKEKQV